MTLIKRVVLWLLAIASVTFLMLTFIGLEIRETIRHNGLVKVQNILAHKLQRIDTYLHQRYTALENLNDLLGFALRHYPVFEANFWNRSPEILQDNLTYFAYKNGFYDVFVVSMDGEVIHSVKKESDLHTNLLEGKYRHTELARVVGQALKNEKPRFSNFTYYEPSRDYAAFIAAPVFSKGKMVGVVAVQIDNKTIQSVTRDYTELGKTGRIIAAAKCDGKLLTMSPVRNTNIKAFEWIPPDPEDPVALSAGGGSGQAYRVDASGNKTAVSWAYQEDLRWGVVVSMDESELLHQWYHRITSVTVLFVLGVVIVLLMVIIAFRSFSRPIMELTRYALIMSRGNYDIKINTEQYDVEWQLLTRAFQRMSADIKEKIDQLSEQNRMLEMHKSEIEELNRKLEAKIRIKSQKMQEYVNVIDHFIIVSQTDRSGRITYASDAFCRISGYSKEELIGKSHRIIRHPDMSAELFEDLWKTISSGEVWQGEIKNLKADGGYYWVDTTITPDRRDGEIVGYTAVRHDITDKKRIEELVITDSMTGLYNRRHYVEVIESEMNRARRHGNTMALMMLDVDYFKRYNDTYGHQAGDAVLSRVAEVLKSYTSRSGEYAFRIGGEEFALILCDMNADQYLKLGDRICREVEELGLVHEHNDAAPHVTVSIGIALYRGDSRTSCEELYKEADMQLYRAKERGRNQVAMG